MYMCARMTGVFGQNRGALLLFNVNFRQNGFTLESKTKQRLQTLILFEILIRRIYHCPHLDLLKMGHLSTRD